MTSFPIIAWVNHLGHARQSTSMHPLAPHDPPHQVSMNYWFTQEAQLPDFVRRCPVALRYLHLLGPLAWDHLPERRTHANGNPHPLPYAPLAAACV